MSAARPNTVKAFEDVRGKFEAWIINHGAEIRMPTNPYEIARFTTPDGIGVVYRNKKMEISDWNQAADRAYDAWRRGDDNWRLCKKTKRPKLSHQQATIIARDGEGCWYCGQPFTDESPETTEHLVSRIHRGPDHLSNLVLSHEPCNLKAGNLSVAEKVRLREQMRSIPEGEPKS